MTKTAIIACVVILSAIIGFALGRSNITNPILKPTPITSTPTQKVQTTTSQTQNPNLLFKTQSATFQGKITKITGNSLSVEADSGEKGEIQLAQKATIYKFAANSPTAVASTDLKTLEVNKKVLMTLELLNGKYQAVSISFFKTP